MTRPPTGAGRPTVRSDRAAAPAFGTRPRVLLLEDVVGLQVLLRSALETAGFAVLTAPDGTEAPLAVERFDPDVVVLDGPHPDGLTLAGRLRGSGHRAAVLFLTTYDNPSDRPRAAALNAAVLARPFRLAELLATVRVLSGTAGCPAP
jgi:DNA-binding response OmpR family regulator